MLYICTVSAHCVGLSVGMVGDDCVRACVHACVRVCVRACVRACVF